MTDIQRNTRKKNSIVKEAKNTSRRELKSTPSADGFSLFDTTNETTSRITRRPEWLSWLERQSHNLKVVSSSLTSGRPFLFHIFSSSTFVGCSRSLQEKNFVEKSRNCIA